VKLNQDELDALEKRRKRMQSTATSRERKGSGSSGSGSEMRRRSDKNLISVPIAAAAEPSSQKKGKSKRTEDAPHPPAATNPPGMLVAGPDGLTFAPISHYPQAKSSRNSPTRPRSSTFQQRGAPPQPAYPQGSTRHFSEGMRPASSSSTSSRRPLPDEEGWVPLSSRRSSGSSQSHGADPFEYQVSSEQPPPIPQQYVKGRRNVSGPEVSYSSVRRSLPVGYSAAARAPASDPVLRKRSSYRDELGDSQSSSEDDEDESDELGNGVQVFVEEREVERERTVPRKPVGGGRKKGKGR